MRVLIRNFQSLAMVDMLVKGLTVIVGPSNIGKSSLIRAITAGLYHMAGDEFVRRGENSASVEIYGAPTVDGGTIDIEWHKGKGVNKFVINGAVYDKVAREVPLSIIKAGYHEIQIGDEWIRPQVSEQHDLPFLLKRSGSFVHDVIAQASRLSVLLRADRNCSTDLKRQKATQKLRIQDLEEAKLKLEEMAEIRDLHGRIQAIRPKVAKLRVLCNKLDDLKEMATARAQFKDITSLQLPVSVPLPDELAARAEKIQEIQRLSEERRLYLGLPENVPSEKPYDFDGMVKASHAIDLATRLAEERKTALREYRDAQSAFKSIDQELQVVEAELQIALEGITICPVCERPMPGKEALEHAEVHPG